MSATEKTERTGFWAQVKTGFAYAFGGNLGWRLGNVVGDLIARLWKWLIVALFGWHFASGLGLTHDDPKEASKTEPAAVQKAPAKTGAAAHRVYTMRG